MASNGGDNQHQYSSDNNEQEYDQQRQRRRFNDYPPHAYHSNEKILTQQQTQNQAHYGGVHLQTNYKYSVTEVGEPSNRFFVHQQAEESPRLSLSKSTPVVNQSQLSLTQRSNKKNRKKELIASENSKLKAANFSASSIQIGYWVKEAKNQGDVVVKFYYGKKRFVWEFLYGSLKKKMEIRWSQVSAIKTFDDKNLNGYIVLELSEPPEFSEETDYTAKMYTRWHATKDDFTGGQASIYRVHTVKCPPRVLNKPFSDLLSSNSYLQSLSQQPFPRHSPAFHNLNGLVYSAKQCQYASASNPVTNHGNRRGEFINYVPNVVQPSGCFVGNVYPNIPSPALNQIARIGSHETPGTNGVTPLALNQIATRDSYENPRVNGVDTPALNQVATGASYINPKTNGVIPQAVNQIIMGDIYKDPRTNGVWVQRGNDGIQDMSLIADSETENLRQYNNEQTFLNDKQTNKPVNQSYLMNPNTDHSSFVDSSILPDGVAIPMVDSGIGGSQTLECLDEHDIALLQSFMNMDDLDAENVNDFEDAFKTFDGNEFP